MIGEGLLFCSLFERDTNNDVLGTWSYPAIESSLLPIVIVRSGLAEEKPPAVFSFSKFKNTWLYVYTILSPGVALPRVKAFSLCIGAEAFNPELYGELAKQLAELYASKGSPLPLLDAYLSVFSTGSAPTIKFKAAEFDIRKAFLVTPLKDIVKALGKDVVLLWTALLLKRRVVVTSTRLTPLLKFMRALPLLVWHRQNWAVLRPYCCTSKSELAELQAAGVYVAGFIDPAVRNQPIYDLLLDLDTASVVVPPHAKTDFALGHYQEELATFLTESAASAEYTDQKLIKELTLKTKGLIGGLENLAEEVEGSEKKMVRFETLQARNLPPGMDRFLFSIAAAEGKAAN